MQSMLHKVVGPEEVHPKDLRGRVAVITGGPTGIGYEVSRALAHAGCKVIMVNRREDQGSEAVEELTREAPESNVSWRECDLGNLAQVRTVFSNLRDSLERLDFVVLSSGLNANQYGLDSDGIERVFGVNYLGHYYAANLLWPKIRETSLMPGVTGPRVVVLSSKLHASAPSQADFSSLMAINDDSLTPVELYGRSKLAINLFVRFGLLERVIKPSSDSIFAVAVHPGTVDTKLQDELKDAYPGLAGQLLSFAAKSASRDPEQGAYGTLWALTSPELDDMYQKGVYFTDPGKLGNESTQASDEKLGEQLWRFSASLIREKLGDDALIPWI